MKTSSVRLSLSCLIIIHSVYCRKKRNSAAFSEVDKKQTLEVETNDLLSEGYEC